MLYRCRIPLNIFLKFLRESFPSTNSEHQAINDSMDVVMTITRIQRIDVTFSYIFCDYWIVHNVFSTPLPFSTRLLLHRFCISISLASHTSVIIHIFSERQHLILSNHVSRLARSVTFSGA